MKAKLERRNIGFIGGGNVTSCLAAGMIRRGVPPDHIMVSDRHASKRRNLERQLALLTTGHNDDVLRFANVLVLAVKPQSMRQTLLALSPEVGQHQPLVISVAAGIHSDQIRRWLGVAWPVVRMMPNTPAMVGAGATALYATVDVDPTQRQQALALAESVGLGVWIEDEALMDVVTAVSGSGPAYFFLAVEMLQDAAVELGLPLPIARALTAQTALGAVRMLSESGKDPKTLRQDVTSKGGTTERALEVFQTCGLRETFMQAVAGATERGRELALMEDD